MDDLDLAVELFTDPEVVQYVCDVMTPDSIEQALPTYIKRCGGGCIGVWCITETSSNQKLGTVALLPLPIELDDTDWSLLEGPGIPDGDIETGYFLKKLAWGKGYATEAVNRILRFAFENTPLQEIVATLDDENYKSRNVLEKAGLREVGKRFCYAEANCPDLRITKEEWLERTAI
ncbi:MAG: GNAT family N-acetyltransferase [Rhodospirillales bacterium]|nr:GNAT family N-acetyltransferase [Rhodospirillales bacterium]